jgi:ABC-type branched-subunit amino acid transport system substrate-binding protein
MDRLNQAWVNATGFPGPIGYTANIYDGLWILSLSAIEAESTEPLEIMKILPDVASKYVGATGRCTLDETGARAGADYGVYMYLDVDGVVQSKECGRYNWEEAGFTWFSRP